MGLEISFVFLPHSETKVVITGWIKITFFFLSIVMSEDSAIMVHFKSGEILSVQHQVLPTSCYVYLKSKIIFAPNLIIKFLGYTFLLDYEDLRINEIFELLLLSETLVEKCEFPR